MKIKTTTKITPNVTQAPSTVVTDEVSATVETEQDVVTPEVDTEVVPPTEDEQTSTPIEPDETPVPETPKEPEMPIVIPEVKTETIVPAAPVDNVPLPVKFMIAYIDEYIKLISQQIPDTNKCNETFEKLMRHAIKNQDNTAVLEELFSFFMSKKAVLLKPSVVLAGIPAAKRGIRERIQIAYMLMYELISGSKGPFDFEYAAKILEGTGYVSFIKSRIR